EGAWRDAWPRCRTHRPDCAVSAAASNTYRATPAIATAGIPKVLARSGAPAAAATDANPFQARAHGRLAGAIRASAEGNGIPIGNATAAQTAASATGARGRTKTRATSAITAVGAHAARHGRRSRDERRLPAPDPRRNPPTTAAAASTGLPKRTIALLRNPNSRSMYAGPSPRQRAGGT